MSANSRSGSAALTLEAISKSFGATPVLDDVSLAIQPGEFIALVGPSGCGKSTLLRIAAGLEDLTAGRVLLDGHDVTDVRAADRDMAMVFQSYALYPHLTARHNMTLPLAMRRLTTIERFPLIGPLLSRDKRARIHQDVLDAAASLRIDHLLERKPGQLSGGQRQRVALGRALVRRPRAFLMDEPLSNLDATLRVHMRNEIVDLHKKAGVITLYVTHDQEEALSMADRVAVMLGGRILQIASPTEIYREPAHIDVATFIGNPRINLISAVVDGGRRAIAGDAVVATGVTASAGSAVTIGIRPEHLALASEAGPGSLPVRMVRTEFLGAEALVHLHSGAARDTLIARVTPAAAQGLAQEGPLFATPTPTNVLVFDAAGARVERVPAVREVTVHAG